MRHLLPLACVSVALATLLGGDPAAFARAPRIEFDVPAVIPCRDVTPEAFARWRPNEKLVEARVAVSALLRKGEEKGIGQLVYSLVSPPRRMEVVDFLPKTQTMTDVDGLIEITANSEVSADGKIQAQYRSIRANAELSASASARQTSQVSLHKLPPRQVLLASGTINFGHGVFLKLRPSTQDSLEGQKEFVCMFVVPRAWRGDWAVVDCKAMGAGKVFGAGEVEGSRVVVAALCLEDDAEAKSAALHLAQLQEADARNGFFPLYDALVKYDRLLQEFLPELAREYAPGGRTAQRWLRGEQEGKPDKSDRVHIRVTHLVEQLPSVPGADRPQIEFELLVAATELRHGPDPAGGIKLDADDLTRAYRARQVLGFFEQICGR